jgi:hypothetical protein
LRKNQDKFDPKEIRKNAERFSPENFRKSFKDFVNLKIKEKFG